jgi:hypothetical protein
MAEREIPGQRDRAAGAPKSGRERERVLAAQAAGRDYFDDLNETVFDEEFVRAAPVCEASARTRMLEARWRREPPPSRPWRAEPSEPHWSVRPARRVRSIRFSAAAVVGCAVVVTFALLTLTR